MVVGGRIVEAGMTHVVWVMSPVSDLGMSRVEGRDEEASFYFGIVPWARAMPEGLTRTLRWAAGAAPGVRTTAGLRSWAG